MPLITVTSPHLTGRRRTGAVMRQVIYATLPGLLVLAFVCGPGVWLNVLWCLLLAVGVEAACLRLRGRPVLFSLQDGSALVTGLLLGLALPALSPWWLGLTGMVFAIAIAKHLYGGLGSNPFNPAMIAYALLLVSFPAEMTRWPLPAAAPDLMQAWQAFSGRFPMTDGLTGATPLDAWRQAAGRGDAGWAAWPALTGWAGVNLAFLLGGLYLLARRIISLPIPAAMLGTLCVLSLAFHSYQPERFAGPLFHLFSGATMLGAFFIATDPVTAATSRRGQWLYGAGIGLLVFIIRTWGGYPDAVAFAVLLMNLAAPMMDHLVRPRTFGHAARPVVWKGGKPQ